ncbi:MAG TPA: hypothetical protein P5234_04510 [Thermoanaerobaculaceae bacterium]|nr:hypothetical protein [Thermoanaerobaculaceae bacterium]HRS15493.1 hypothetical protein [Thermoanaerobaculaceae bacterium]
MRMTQPREITESFRLDRVLKSSRSGIVFRATELASGRGAAIKLIAPSCPADLHICQEQFLEAMDGWRDTAPPAFPALFDFGFTPDGSAFMVMEYVEGTPLDALIGIDPPRLLRLALGWADSLARLAERGVFHGNLTPQNLLVRSPGTGETPLVLGFGTAAFRVFMGELTGAVLASDALEYAAPELIDPHGGLARANARSDMYSLAAVLCRALEAKVATSPERTVSVLLSPAVSQALPAAGALGNLLVRLLDPEPERRLFSWGDVMAELASLTPAAAPAGAAAVAPEPAPSGTLFLALPELPPVPPAGAEVPTPAETPETPAELAERTQAIPVVAGEPETAPPPGEGGEELSPEAAPTVPPAPPAPATAPEPSAAPAAVETAPPPYEAERTMAVPVHRLVELPAAERPAPEPQTPPSPAPPAAVAGPEPPAFGPPAAPPPPVFGPAATDSTPAVLYDTDKGRVAVQPVAPPPLPAPEQPSDAGPPPAPDWQAAPETAPIPEPVPAAVAPSELAAPVLEPDIASAASAPTTAQVTGRQAISAPAAARRRRSLWPLWLVLAVLLLGGGGLGLLWWKSQQAELEARRRFVPPTPRPATPAPTPIPKQPPAVLAQVRALEEALAAADLKTAQQVLESITDYEEQLLSAADREHLQGLREAYGELRVRSLGSDLQRALEAGNVRAVQRVMNSLTREEQAALARDPDRAQALEEARRALNVLRLAQNAERSGAWVDLLQQAGALREIMPKAEIAAELREKAARGLEAEATTAAEAGNYQQAQERLVALARAWPDRPGVQARLERLRADQEADQKVVAALAQAEQAERQQQPEKGLAALQAVRPTARLEARVAETRRRLAAQLRQLDAQPPKVELQRGARLEYEKGKMARIPFVVTDDHGIKSAKMFARVEGGGKYAEMNLTRGSGDEWIGEITAAFHRNENVQLFVVVTDHSEQVGVLGSADKPLLLKRKKVLGIF